VDVALVEGPCRRPELNAEPFLNDEIVWICAPGHRLARARCVTVQELLATPVVTREIGGGVRQFVETELQRHGRSLDEARLVQEIPHPEAIKRAVMGGEVISFLFRIGVAEEISAGLLHAIHCPGLKLVRPFSMLTPRGPAPSGVLSSFRDALLEAPLSDRSKN
jgi:DNA-binding transcriptional LysR family regulator